MNVEYRLFSSIVSGYSTTSPLRISVLQSRISPRPTRFAARQLRFAPSTAQVHTKVIPRACQVRHSVVSVLEVYLRRACLFAQNLCDHFVSELFCSRGLVRVPKTDCHPTRQSLSPLESNLAVLIYVDCRSKRFWIPQQGAKSNVAVINQYQDIQCERLFVESVHLSISQFCGVCSLLVSVGGLQLRFGVKT